MIRVALVILFLLGGLVSYRFLIKFFEFFDGSQGVLAFLSNQTLTIVVCVGILLLGYLLRAYGWSVLMRPIKKGPLSVFFSSLSIGFMCNALLPFRLGEIVRAVILGKSLSVSTSAVFMTVLVERLIDAIILFAFFNIFIFASSSAGFSLSASVGFLYAMFVGSIGLMTALLVLVHRQPAWLLELIGKGTGVFNRRIRNRLRMSTWSAIFGLNLLRFDTLKKYVVISAGIWIVNIAALSLFFSLSANISILHSAYVGLGSFLTLIVPTGSGYLGTHQYFLSDLGGAILQAHAPVGMIILTVWGMTVVPIAMVGAIYFALLLYRGRITPHGETDPHVNKLLRGDDLSTEMSVFFSGYFSNKSAGKLVHELEITEGVRLQRYFEGGSGVTTMLLALPDGSPVVRKIATPDMADKLRNQFLWLDRHKASPAYPTPLGEKTTSFYYYYDMPHYGNGETFFDFIHRSSTEQGIGVLKRLLKIEHALCGQGHIASLKSELAEYLETKILQKIDDSCKLNAGIASLDSHDTILVNGEECLTPRQSVEHIRNDGKLFGELSSCLVSSIHGDLTVDNILIWRDKIIILDPNDDNTLSDILVDYAKLYQSLHSGYEFLVGLESARVNGNKVDFEEAKSVRYDQLFEWLDAELRRQLSPERYRAVLFHEAVHYSRMLTYKCQLHPEAAPAFYGICARLLHRYLTASSAP